MKNGSLLTFAFLFIFSTFLSGQSNPWTGNAANGLWNDANNWTLGIPNNNDARILVNETVKPF